MADELKPAYLIAGTDRPKVDRAVARLRARFEADAVELLDAAETSGDDAVAACNALGLFGSGSRLVLVAGVEAWKAPDAKAVGEYLAAPLPGTTLALVAGELKKDAPIAKAVAAKGEVLALRRAEPRTRRLGRRAVQAARHLERRRGVPAPDRAGRRRPLRARDRGRQARDLGCRRRIGAAEVEELVAPRAQSPGFALTDAWGDRDVAGVLRASEHLLERTGDPHSRTIPRLAATLTSHVARIRTCRALDSEGVASKDAAARLKLHPYYVQKLYAQARNYSERELRDATDAARRARPCAEGRLATRRASSSSSGH